MSGKPLNLFNGGRPMTLHVAFVDAGEDVHGLTERSVKATLKSYLRGVNLYTRSDAAARDAYLYGRIVLVGSWCFIDLSFHKVVTDEYGNRGIGQTWEDSNVILHRRNSRHVLGSLKKQAQKFVAEYLRVNRRAGD